MKIFLPGYPTGKTGDQGDQTEFYGPKFYVPFLLPMNFSIILNPG